VAFAGRSNAGKSSLINSIVLRKNLAHTSSTPGKTKEINFYIVENRWSFADLPGLGYTSAGKKSGELWANLIFEYFENRKNLKLVCVLVDSRHEPMQRDLALIEWLENKKMNYLIVLTKCDKISARLLDERKSQFEYLIHKCNYVIECLPYSSKTGLGRNELIAILKRYLY
jgi:GTP-binding protein